MAVALVVGSVEDLDMEAGSEVGRAAVLVEVAVSAAVPVEAEASVVAAG